MIARAIFTSFVLLAPVAASAEPLRLDPNSLIERIPVQAPADVLSGSWQTQGRMESGGQLVALATPICEFQQAGTKLSGSCHGPNAQGPLSGAVVGRHVTWDWQAKATSEVGLTGVAAFKGDLGADGVVRGTWTMSITPGLSGEFTLTRRASAG